MSAIACDLAKFFTYLFQGEDNSLYLLADPICTFIFSVLVLITTITVIRDAFFILMEGELLICSCFPFTNLIHVEGGSIGG